MLGGLQKLAVLFLAAGGTLLLLMGQLQFGWVTWSIAYGWILLTNLQLLRRGRATEALTSQILSKELLVIGSAGPLIHLGQHGEMYLWTAFIMVVLSLPLISEMLPKGEIRRVRTTNLGLPTLPNYAARWATVGVAGQLVSLPLILVLASGGVHGFIGVVLTMLNIGIITLSMILFRQGQSRLARENHRMYIEIPEILSIQEPNFLVHWDAPAASKYQLDMWLPYLEKIGLPFILLVRNRAGFASAVSAAPRVPVILASSHSDMERLLVASLTTAFYVNNADRNNQLLRFEHLKHIQLGHGDSDKATSSTRIFMLFDRVYMAGQAGINRFRENGVEIPESKFAVVGRPQILGINQDLSFIGNKENPTVLYAPTWRGDFKDSSYSSLPYFIGLVELLLQSGATVIFRPHPFTSRHQETAEAAEVIRRTLRAHREESGLKHLFGDDAENKMSINDCFNQSDVMISDISAISSDYLYSGKPLGLFIPRESGISEMENHGWYRFSEDSEGWAAQLENLLVDDPLRPRRLELRGHYLGNATLYPPDKLFVKTARSDILAQQKSG